ncbi:GATA transcription factor 5-like [Euphorbia lathyris]|uniref:GATA transcription factor 5-like n=1 Tax=Euphorbia lathyris TaxID=212925 RepID=UPI0033133A70
MEYGMELATALKSSLIREYLPPAAFKSTQQSLFDDLLSHNSNNIGVGTDDFSVDCFFDFSNGEFKDGNNNAFGDKDRIILEEEDEEEEEKDSLSVSSQDRVDDDNHSNFSTFSDSFLASELAVPADDLAELEWVSHFVDDSLPQFPVLYPLKSEKQFKPEPQPVFTKPSCVFPAKIPAKARSKRPRITRRTWLVGSSLTDSTSSFSSSSSSSSYSSPISSSSSNFCLVNMPITDNFQRPLKKPKKKPATQTGVPAVQCQRRCSHCQVQKTPQWRTGPLGAKTLCNACGVRYKSGRLFPEYRPACSPTFSSDVHSNSHRKVVEIRKKKEMSGPESGLNQMVPSF